LYQWMDEVVLSYQDDAMAQKLPSQLAAQPDSIPHYTLVQGIIRYHDRVWLGSSKVLQQHVLSAFHASSMGGHSGAPATYCRIKRLFYWQGMKADVWAFVRACTICLQAKPDRARYPGLLQPLPMPSHVGRSYQWISLKGFHSLGLLMRSWSW
jgi:hypothetical protein